MGKEYKIKKLSEVQATDSNVWDLVAPARIDNYVWDENDYLPEAYAKVFYTESHLHVKLTAYEKEIRAVNTKMNEPVYQDSCLEFFVKPDPEKDDRYMNFETNCIGAMLLGLGKDRNGRTLITDQNDYKSFKIKASVKPDEVDSYKEDCWSIEYSIPYTFFEKIYGKLQFESGKRLKANFYKCGDNSRHAHYGSWNKITMPKPDFHVPQFFGDLILE